MTNSREMFNKMALFTFIRICHSVQDEIYCSIYQSFFPSEYKRKRQYGYARLGMRPSLHSSTY